MGSLIALLTALFSVAEVPSETLLVHGATDCPTAVAVQTALRPLLSSPPPSANGRPDIADLRVEGERIVVRLRTDNGTLVAEKPLPLSESCAERAATAAVILAAWQARLQSGARASLPLPPDEPPAPAAPSPLAPAPPPIAAPATSPLAPIRSRPPEAARAPGAAWQVIPGAALLGSFQDGGVSGGAVLEAEVHAAGSPYALGLGALLVANHDKALAPGQAAWWRAGGVIDGRRLWRLSSAVDVEIRMGFILTRVAVSGHGFASNGSNSFLDPGALAGARLVLGRAALRPWLELAAGYWLRQHTLVVAGTDQQATPARLQLLLALGMAFGRPG